MSDSFRWDSKIERLKAENYNGHVTRLREAYAFAWANSHDSSTKNAAVIYNDDGITGRYVHFASGANHFPTGMNPTPEQIANREWKLKHIIHAEQAAINRAAMSGAKTQNSVMYMPWVPCTPCAAAIVDAGIEVLIGHEDMINLTPEEWREDCFKAIDVLLAGGVTPYMISGKVGGVKGLFRGKIWEP